MFDFTPPALLASDASGRVSLKEQADYDRWANEAAGNLVKRQASASLSAVYDADDARALALSVLLNPATIEKARASRQPTKFLVTCAANRLRDEVRKWRGRYGKKAEGMSFVSLDATRSDGSGFLSAIPDERASQAQSLLESDDRAEAIVNFLPNPVLRDVAHGLYVEGLTLPELAGRMKVGQKRVGALRDEALSFLKQKFGTLDALLDM